MVPSDASLEITKDSDPIPSSTVSVGDTITYELTISNTGSITLPNVIVQDVLDSHLDYVAGSGGTYNASTRTVSWSPFALNPGQSVTRSFSVTVNSVPSGAGGNQTSFSPFSTAFAADPTSGQVCNTASASNSSPLASDTSNQVCHPVEESGQAALSITKDSDPIPSSTVSVDDTITYELTITNTGDIPLQYVIARDVIQEGLAYVPGSASHGGTYNTSSRTVSWSPFALNPGQSVTRSFQVEVVSVPTDQQVCNQGSVSHQNPNINSLSNQVCHPVEEPGQAALSITKDSDPLPSSTVSVGDTITYELTITNAGDIPLQYVIARDVVQEGLEYVPGSASHGGTYNTSSRTVSWSPFALNPGQSVTRSFQVEVVSVPTDQQVCNQGSVSHQNPNINSLSNQVCHPVESSPGLPSLTKDADPLPGSTVSPGDMVTYTLTVTNPFSTPLFNVSLIDPIDTEYLEFVAVAPGQNCYWNTPEVNCLWETFPAQTSQEVVITTRVKSDVLPGEFCDQGQLLILPFSIIRSNTVCHTLHGEDPGMTILKEADPLPSATVGPLDSLLYSITVTNTGDEVLQNVVVTDVLDDHLQFVAGDPGVNGDPASQTVLLSFGDIDVAISETLSFTVQIRAGTPGGTEICNFATGGADNLFEPVTSNTVCHTVPGGTEPGMTILKEANPLPSATVGPLDSLLYSLTVTNTGSETLQNVVVTDILDDHLQFVSGDPGVNGDPASQTVLLSFGDIDVGVSEMLSFTVQVRAGTPGGTEICNYATGGADNLFEPVTSNTVCHTVPGGGGGEECGNGVLDPGEECDNGRQCSDGTQCDDHAQCIGIGDEMCLPRSDDGCSASCILEDDGGGGGGGAEIRYTLGICQWQGSGTDCVTHRIEEDVDDPAWQAFHQCMLTSPHLNAKELCAHQWLAHKSALDDTNYRLCGETIPTQSDPAYYPPFDLSYPIEVPIVGNSNDFMQQGLINLQCGIDDPFGGGCEEPCPTCVIVEADIEKEIIGKKTVAKEDTVTYEVTVTLRNETDNDDTVEFFGGDLRVVDTIVASLSNGLWERTGITSLTPGWTWDEDGSAFLYHLETADVAPLDTGNIGEVSFTLRYEMDLDLAPHMDLDQLVNAAFARIYLIHESTSPPWLDEEGNEVIPDPISGDDEFCSAYGIIDPSTLGSTATVTLVRPFLEAKRGGNIGLDYTVSSGDENLFGKKQEIGSNANIEDELNTSGRIFEREGGLFDSYNDLLERVNDFEGLGDFIESDRDAFFENLRNNLQPSPQNFFGADFRTTLNNSGVYFGDGPLTLSGVFNADNQSKTFVVESGDVQINGDFSIQNGFAAFIIRNGNLIIAPEVESLEGVFIVEQGEILSDDISETQLNISGGIMGDAADLLDKRRFIGDDPDTSLEPSIRILFDLRLLEKTPPALEQFLGRNWREEVE